MAWLAAISMDVSYRDPSREGSRMNATTPTTADVGLALASYMRRTEPVGGDPQVYRDLVALLMDSRATTPADALALVSWLAAFLPIANAMLPEDEDETGGPKALIANASHMAVKAKIALEIHTGYAAETFTGLPGPSN